MTLEKAIWLFLIFFVLTILSSIAGDDDVVYKFFDRKPTGKEAIARIRFVLAKAFASIYGGGLMGFAVGQFILKKIFLLTISKDQAVVLIVACIALTALLIGVVQNLIRHIQDRKQRPIFDLALLQYNLKRWSQPNDWA
jgi:hypothetical protein